MRVPVRVTVLDSQEINAFALPGGLVFVNTIPGGLSVLYEREFNRSAEPDLLVRARTQFLWTTTAKLI
jgi:hypothetical protein